MFEFGCIIILMLMMFGSFFISQSYYRFSLTDVDADKITTKTTEYEEEEEEEDELVVDHVATTTTRTKVVVQNPCPSIAIWDYDEINDSNANNKQQHTITYSELYLSFKHILEKFQQQTSEDYQFWVSDGSLLATVRYGGVTGCHRLKKKNQRFCYDLDDDFDMYIINMNNPIYIDNNNTNDWDDFIIQSEKQAMKDLGFIKQRVEEIIYDLDQDNNNIRNPWHPICGKTFHEINKKVRCHMKKEYVIEKNSSKLDDLGRFPVEIMLNQLIINKDTNKKFIYRFNKNYQAWDDNNNHNHNNHGISMIPYEYIFPLKHGAFYSETINVPSKYLQLLGNWGKKNEYGRYCEQIIPNEPPDGFLNNNTRGGMMELLRKDIKICSENLHKQGLASFYECFENENENERE